VIWSIGALAAWSMRRAPPAICIGCSARAIRPAQGIELSSTALAAGHGHHATVGTGVTIHDPPICDYFPKKLAKGFSLYLANGTAPPRRRMMDLARDQGESDLARSSSRSGLEAL
jgi:hypothetical protein